MVINAWSYHNMHIPILLFGEEHFKKRIRFLAIFWKKICLHLLESYCQHFENVKESFFQNIAKNIYIFFKCSSSMYNLWYVQFMIWSCINNPSKLMIFKLTIFIYLKMPIWRCYIWGINNLILYYYSTIWWGTF